MDWQMAGCAQGRGEQGLPPHHPQVRLRGRDLLQSHRRRGDGDFRLRGRAPRGGVLQLLLPAGVGSGVPDRVGRLPGSSLAKCQRAGAEGLSVEARGRRIHLPLQPCLAGSRSRLVQSGAEAERGRRGQSIPQVLVPGKDRYSEGNRQNTCKAQAVLHQEDAIAGAILQRRHAGRRRLRDGGPSRARGEAGRAAAMAAYTHGHADLCQDADPTSQSQSEGQGWRVTFAEPAARGFHANGRFSYVARAARELCPWVLQLQPKSHLRHEPMSASKLGWGERLV
mmetsp:Transcript_37831/g.90486  ORF Transcript_37831/g.90486 Transcript_37831/m.90486 type:complete len:281 (+) Transcript_37831:1676-2518(+)